jgi:hypothetical protein
MLDFVFFLGLEKLIRNEKEIFVLEENKFSRNRKMSFEGLCNIIY